MATGYGVCVHIVYEHRAISCTGPRGQVGVNPHRGCAEIERKLCNLSGVAVQSPQPPDGNLTEPCVFRAEAARKWCGDRGTTMLFLSVRPPRGACAGIVRCHLRHVYGLRTYDYSNLYNFLLNKIIEAVETVNPYENLTAASCLRTEASQRPHGKGDTGRIRAP